jgi:serine phosphatase RsbU (regulator of sigma subunit)
VSAPGQVLRRTLYRLGDALRPHRWLVLALSVAAESVVLGALVSARTADTAQEIAVSFMALTAVIAATLAGPGIGALVALIGGGIFFVTVADFGADTSLLATSVSTAAWVVAALVSGFIAEALREQGAQRVEATIALAQARAVSQTAEHLLAATASFHGGEDLQAVAEDVCQTAISLFGCDSAVILLADDATLQPLAASPHAQHLDSGSLSLADLPGLARLVELKRPTHLDDMASIGVLAADIWRDLPWLAPAGAAVFVPLRPGGAPLGLLTLGWSREAERPDHAHLAVMQRFADQAAIALVEASRAQARSEAAALHVALEAGLLPTLPVHHPAFEVVTAYRPGEGRLLLGGDFYDVLSLPDGRLALILGDVSGHGPQAAALGARLRAGWQALTLSGAGASAIVSGLERVVAIQGASELLATVVLAWIDHASRSASLLCAGHPPPLLLAKGVHPVHLRPYLPLGVGRKGAARPTTLQLPRDWTLLFYTDGLIEGRAAPGSADRYGEAKLITLLRQDGAAPFDSQTLERVVAEVEGANGAPFGDDVAVVAVSEKRPYEVHGSG